MVAAGERRKTRQETSGAASRRVKASAEGSTEKTQLTHNVKRWRDGQMVLRWAGTALQEAGCGFRAVRGYRDIKQLTGALAQRVSSNFDVESKVA